MKQTNWLSSDAGKICECSFLALAVTVPFGMTLAGWPHPSSPIKWLIASTWESVSFLCLGIILLLVAWVLDKRCDSLKTELELGYPWPEGRLQELRELIRRRGDTERQVEFYELIGTLFCMMGLGLALVGLMASPFAILPFRH